MTRYKWDAIDDRFNWVAKDSDGRVYAYNRRPAMGEIWWYPIDGISQQLGYARPWENHSDWRESLEERPKPSKRYELSSSEVILDTAERKWLDLLEVVDRLNEYEEGKA